MQFNYVMNEMHWQFIIFTMQCLGHCRVKLSALYLSRCLASLFFSVDRKKKLWTDSMSEVLLISKDQKQR